jgi:hypothetical protein
VNAIDRIVGQKAIHDENSWKFPVNGLNTSRFQKKPGTGPKVTGLKRLNESSHILSRVGHISDTVKCVGHTLSGSFVRFLIGKEAKNIPGNLWKLLLEDPFAKIRSHVERLVLCENPIDWVYGLGLTNSHVGHFFAQTCVMVHKRKLVCDRENKCKSTII